MRASAESFATAAALALALGAGSAPAHAQQSASYRLHESVLNAAGHPAQTIRLTSPGYVVTLDAVGDSVAGGHFSAPSYNLGSGFVGPYVPPGEVQGLAFTSATSLAWLVEPSAGTYNLYRVGLAALPGDFGQCLVQGLGMTSAADMGTPAVGSAFFYLVTAENLLAEEGTMGQGSNGTGRSNTNPCP